MEILQKPFFFSKNPEKRKEKKNKGKESRRSKKIHAREGGGQKKPRKRERERGIKEGRQRVEGGGGDASFPCRITIAMAANQIE